MNTRTKTYATFSGIVLLVLFCAWMFLFLSVKGKEQAAAAALIVASQNRGKEAALFSDAIIARNAEASSQELSGFFASSTNVASVVEAIEGAGKAEKVTVSITSISVGTATSSLSSLSFSVSATGAWGNLVAFVGGLESLPYDIALSEVSFFKDTGPKSTWHVSANASSFISN